MRLLTKLNQLLGLSRTDDSVMLCKVPIQNSDPFTHPEIARMTPCMLADLPPEELRDRRRQVQLDCQAEGQSGGD